MAHHSPYTVAEAAASTRRQASTAGITPVDIQKLPLSAASLTSEPSAWSLAAEVPAAEYSAAAYHAAAYPAEAAAYFPSVPVTSFAGSAAAASRIRAVALTPSVPTAAVRPPSATASSLRQPPMSQMWPAAEQPFAHALHAVPAPIFSYSAASATPAKGKFPAEASAAVPTAAAGVTTLPLPFPVTTFAASTDRMTAPRAVRGPAGATAQREQPQATLQLQPDKECSCCGWLLSPALALLAVCGSWMLFGGPDGEIVLLLAAAPGLILLYCTVTSAGSTSRISTTALAECFWLGAILSVGIAITVELICNFLLFKTSVSVCIPTPLVRSHSYSRSDVAAAPHSMHRAPLLSPSSLSSNRLSSFSSSFSSLLDHPMLQFPPRMQEAAAASPAVLSASSAATAARSLVGALTSSFSAGADTGSSSSPGSSLHSSGVIRSPTTDPSPATSISSFFSSSFESFPQTIGSFSGSFTALFLQPLHTLSSLVSPLLQYSGVRAPDTNSPSLPPSTAFTPSRQSFPTSSTFSVLLSSYKRGSSLLVLLASPFIQALPAATQKVLSLFPAVSWPATARPASAGFRRSAKTATAATAAAASASPTAAAVGKSCTVCPPVGRVVDYAAENTPCHRQQQQASATPLFEALVPVAGLPELAGGLSFFYSLLPPLSLPFYFPLIFGTHDHRLQCCAAPAAAGDTSNKSLSVAAERPSRMQKEDTPDAATQTAAETSRDMPRGMTVLPQPTDADVQGPTRSAEQRSQQGTGDTTAADENAAAAADGNAAAADAQAADGNAPTADGNAAAAGDVERTENIVEKGDDKEAEVATAASPETTSGASPAAGTTPEERESVSLLRGSDEMAPETTSESAGPLPSSPWETAAGHAAMSANAVDTTGAAAAGYSRRRSDRGPQKELFPPQLRTSRQQHAFPTFWCSLILIIFMVLCVGLVEELSKLLVLSGLQLSPLAVATETAECIESSKNLGPNRTTLCMRLQHFIAQAYRSLWAVLWPRRLVYSADITLAGCAAAGGFAVAENLSYTVGRYGRATVEELLLVAVIRTFTAVPAHIFNTGLAASNIALELYSVLERGRHATKRQQLQQPLLQQFRSQQREAVLRQDRQQQGQQRHSSLLRQSIGAGAACSFPKFEANSCAEYRSASATEAAAYWVDNTTRYSRSTRSGDIISSRCFAVLPGKTATRKLLVLLHSVAPSAMLHGLYDAALQLSAAFAQLSGESVTGTTQVDADIRSYLASAFAGFFLLAAAAAWTTSAVLFIKRWRQVRSLNAFLQPQTQRFMY